MCVEEHDGIQDQAITTNYVKIKIIIFRNYPKRRLGWNQNETIHQCRDARSWQKTVTAHLQ